MEKYLQDRSARYYHYIVACRWLCPFICGAAISLIPVKNYGVNMQFNPAQIDYFGATTGAFSTVTNREIFDSQITLTDYEQAMVIEFFGRDNIFVGNVRQSKGASEHQFRIHPTGETVTLNLVFPKPSKPELRLYLRRDSFKPREGAIWCIFIKSGEIWLGQMADTIWHTRFSDPDNYTTNVLDNDTDLSYQANIDESNAADFEVPSLIYGERKSFQRSAKIARDVIRTANYRCEIEPRLNTFTSRRTENNYVEAHHFIPMGLQGLFTTSLDIPDNICVLNPKLHRQIHLGIAAEVEPVLERLFTPREKFLNSVGIVYDDVKEIYLKA